MELEQFIATSAADAAQQIRAKFGPDAVVVNIRQVAGRWFRQPRIEVLAHAAEPVDQTAGRLLDTTDEVISPVCQPLASDTIIQPAQDGKLPQALKQRPAALLESLGLSPLHAQQVLERVPATQPAWLAEDWKQVRAALAATWIPYHPSPAQLHVFVGAPGVGKTTALCKWLTLSVLLEGKTARVWRLDGARANTSESLSVHGDVLGVPVERSWTNEPISEEIGFVDLPGVTGSDPQAVNALAARLATFPSAQVHLVLNAAYDTTASLAQARALAALRISDVIVTHLDEEPRWCRLWNLVLGVGLPIRFLSAGQNIPGEFMEARVDRVLSHIFQQF
jgi:flagellar biosynthesis protein FlhF